MDQLRVDIFVNVLARECVFVHMYESMHAHACVCACVRACVCVRARARARVCVCVCAFSYWILCG